MDPAMEGVSSACDSSGSAPSGGSAPKERPVCRASGIMWARPRSKGTPCYGVESLDRLNSHPGFHPVRGGEPRLGSQCYRDCANGAPPDANGAPPDAGAPNVST